MRVQALVVSILLLAGLFANSAHAAVIFLNNGGSLITLNDATYSADDVYVRDATCGGEVDFPYRPCLSPGVSTNINVATGAVVNKLSVLDSSSISMSDGTVNGLLAAADFGSINMSGGVVDELLVEHDATLDLNGGTVNQGLEAWDDSIITMNDGLADGLLLVNDSRFIMNAGTVNYLDSWHTSIATIYGGTVGGGGGGDDLNAWDSSVIKFLGGTVTGYLNAGDSSTVTVVGGTVDLDFDSWFESNAAFTGGTVNGDLDAWETSNMVWNGGTLVGELFAGDAAILTVRGFDFRVDGVPVPDDYELVATTGVLTGTLESGDPINNVFYQGGHDYYGDGSWFVTGTITLVPEPGKVLLQAIALLSIGLLSGRRKAVGPLA